MSAVGNNLNQIARLGAVGRLTWNARDAALLRKVGARGETEVLGPWGKAAQTALEHFRWMNLNAGYDATALIDALTWPGEKDL